MIVKICGITRADDAAAAVRSGAAAIGFVFWPASPRYIEPERARQIAEALPPLVTAVGVFVNQDAAEVNRIADTARLGAVQLHGDETPAFAATMRYPVLKACPADDAGLDRWPDRIRLLIDVADPVRRGGTGRTVDWDRAATLAAARDVLLAGGLTPENVVDAVRRVRPFGIDVSSGVEQSPGVKDHRKIDALFAALARMHD
jgi:phosphoribosylanthranilate isomerase